MAGDCDSKLVCGASGGDRAHGPGGADASRQFGIGDSRADGNFLQRLPHTALESRTTNIEWEIETDPRVLYEANDTSDQCLVHAIGADQVDASDAAPQFYTVYFKDRSGKPQTYGRFDIRARFPEVTLPGSQGALWMTPYQNLYGLWPLSGEIDIAEFY